MQIKAGGDRAHHFCQHWRGEGVSLSGCLPCTSKSLLPCLRIGHLMSSNIVRYLQLTCWFPMYYVDWC